MSDRPLAVISAYRPSSSMLPAVAALIDDCDVLIVDDGSGDAYAEVFAEAERAGAEVVALETNSGIAHALNVGIRRAAAQDRPGVVTFDQDSSAPAGLVASLRAVAERGDGEHPGIAVPEFFAEVRQTSARGVPYRARRVIQSGMYIPTEVVRAVGALDESLFIDLVDTEYELRCLSAGVEIWAVPGARLGHALGRTVRLHPLAPLPWPRVTTMVSTPFRYYYRVRNRIVLSRRYLRRYPGRMLREAVVEIVYIAVVVLSARPRRTMWALIRSGIADAVAGRVGIIPPALAAASSAIRWSESRNDR